MSYLSSLDLEHIEEHDGRVDNGGDGIVSFDGAVVFRLKIVDLGDGFFDDGDGSDDFCFVCTLRF